MRCNQCQEKDDSHNVYEGPKFFTAMARLPGYWDENDNWVLPPDPNYATSKYSCSNGHQWSIVKGHVTILESIALPDHLDMDVSIPSSAGGDGQILVVNSTEDDVVWTQPPPGT